MSTRAARAQRAQAVVAAFADHPAADGPRWRLDRGAVAARLAALVDEPRLIRQGRTNLCGPAAMMTLWLRDDPEAAISYAVDLFERGEAGIGTLRVRASPGLRELPYDGDCPPADWMMMAALRDSTNRVLRYARVRGRREAAAAITLPGAVVRWLRAGGYDVRDETNLLVRKGLAHALPAESAEPSERLALVAQEMFATTTWRRRIVSLVPKHWILVRHPVEITRDGAVRLRFWSWGAEHVATIERSDFTRCYYGALIIRKTPLRLAGWSA